MIESGMLAYVVVAATVLVAAVIQASTGFGFGIIVMSFLPLIMLFRTATVVEAVTSTLVCAVLAFRLRHHIQMRMLVWPMVSTAAILPLGLFVMMNNTDSVLRRLLGGFLLLLALYFVFFGDRIRIQATPLSGIVVGVISGFLAGVFAIGGPPMAVYYLAATDDKREYSATLQAYFVVMSVYHLGLHWLWGNLTPTVFRFSAVATLGLVVGSIVGYAVFKRLSMKAIKRAVYIFMAVFGVYLIITG